MELVEWVPVNGVRVSGHNHHRQSHSFASLLLLCGAHHFMRSQPVVSALFYSMKSSCPFLKIPVMSDDRSPHRTAPHRTKES